MRPLLVALFTFYASVQLTGCSGTADGCGPNSCPNGCCRFDSTCSPWTNETCGLTGQPGEACLACASSQECKGGFCQAAPCSPASCASGCCDGLTGQCIVAISNNQCGTGGVTCMQCSNGEQCSGGRCTGGACGPSNCSTCCNSGGQCVPQTSTNYCGFGGGPCQACPSDRICTGGQCQLPAGDCSPQNCSGCCDAQGHCVDTPNAGACGQGGQACASCSGGQACTNGRCTCSPQSCPGCCDGDTCQTGFQPASCGIGGNACRQCGTDESCDKGTCVLGCSPTTCAQGCCTGTVCNLGGQTDAFACGMSANTCKRCLQYDVCQYGTCNDPARCNASNCPTGCCIEGTCVGSGTSNQACGRSGQVCRQCGAGEHCLNGLCDVSPSSRWRVEIIGVAVEPLPGYWDITGAPDIYIEFSVGTITKKTARIGTDSYSEIFNEVVGTVRGEDLTQRSIQWKIMDEDDNDDDVMFECIMTLTGDEIRRKDVFIFDAAEDLPPGRTGQEGTVNADARCLGGQIFWSPFEYLQLRFTREAN